MTNNTNYELRGIKSFEDKQLSFVFKQFRSLCDSYGIEAFFPAILYNKNAFSNSFIQEMFYVASRHREDNESVLAPEYTCILANYFANSSHNTKSFYYISPCFRYERPQRNRKRQFWQLGIENFDKNILFLALIIKMINNFFVAINLNVNLRINFIGSVQIRQQFVLQQKDQIEKYIVCELCKKRLLLNNIFAILECEQCKIMSFLPSISALDVKFEKEKLLFLSYLSNNNISFTEDNCLFRGINYYSNIIFEWQHENTTLGGGGTYIIDNQHGQGMALGADRISNALSNMAIKSIDLFCFDENALSVINDIASIVSVNVLFFARKTSNKAIFLHKNNIVFQNNSVQNTLLRQDVSKITLKHYYEKTFCD